MVRRFAQTRLSPEEGVEYEKAAADCGMEPGAWLHEVVRGALDLHFGRDDEDPARDPGADDLQPEPEPVEEYQARVREAAAELRRAVVPDARRRVVHPEEALTRQMVATAPVVAPPGRKAGPERVRPRDCVHPLTRRVGRTCTVCGTALPGSGGRGR